MRFPVLAAGFTLAVALAGCADIRVKEAHFIRPDAPGAAALERYSGAGITELRLARAVDAGRRVGFEVFCVASAGQ